MKTVIDGWISLLFVVSIMHKKIENSKKLSETCRTEGKCSGKKEFENEKNTKMEKGSVQFSSVAQ